MNPLEVITWAGVSVLVAAALMFVCTALVFCYAVAFSLRDFHRKRRA